MPDWSYRTLIKPILFALPGDWGKRICLGTLQAISRVPKGRKVIEFLGHMTPPEGVACGLGAWGELASPLGLSDLVDPEGNASLAFSHFGFGWICVGPVSVDSKVTLPVDVRRTCDGGPHTR